jgi:hypothetical protein
MAVLRSSQSSIFLPAIFLPRKNWQKPSRQANQSTAGFIAFNSTFNVSDLRGNFNGFLPQGA